MSVETILLFIILASGLYMAWNIGANDVANAMGTSVGAGSLTLRQAVLLAAVMEFSGAFFFGSHVSKTIQEGIVNPEIFADQPMVFVFGMLSALLGAGVWLQIASYYGLPVSTTHSIVGAILGFGLVVGGMGAVYWNSVVYIAFSWILSPLFGASLSFAIFSVLRKYIFYSRHPLKATKKFIPVFVFITMGLITLLMLSKDFLTLPFQISPWMRITVSLFSAVIFCLISYFLLKRVPDQMQIAAKEPVNESVYSQLMEAKKNLESAQQAAHGEVNYQLSTLLDEVQTISHEIQTPPVVPDQLETEYQVVEKIFAYLQIISACMMAFAHGANDVANAIGPLSAAVTTLTTGALPENSNVPLWALALGGFGIVLGLATWGWRVIETIGKKLTELSPSRGFSAEFGAAITILAASRLGLPISATHTLVGSVLGVGLARGIGALNLATMRDILISWLVTIPIGAVMAIAIFYIIQLFFG